MRRWCGARGTVAEIFSQSLILTRGFG